MSSSINFFQLNLPAQMTRKIWQRLSIGLIGRRYTCQWVTTLCIPLPTQLPDNYKQQHERIENRDVELNAGNLDEKSKTPKKRFHLFFVSTTRQASPPTTQSFTKLGNVKTATLRKGKPEVNNQDRCQRQRLTQLALQTNSKSPDGESIIQ